MSAAPAATALGSADCPELTPNWLGRCACRPGRFLIEGSLELPLSRGAVVQHAELSLIIWDDRPGGASFGIRVMPQTGPRHRSHVPLSPAECRALGLPPLASVIRTADPMIAIRAAQAAVLGACSADLLQRIGATIGRARFAADYEQAMTPPLVGARR